MVQWLSGEPDIAQWQAPTHGAVVVWGARYSSMAEHPLMGQWSSGEPDIAQW